MGTFIFWVVFAILVTTFNVYVAITKFDTKREQLLYYFSSMVIIGIICII